ncbi:MAG: hypothetical protein RLZZ127_1206, partial [Planctomycetota bacterium]
MTPRWWSPWARAGIDPRRHLLWPGLAWLAATIAWEASQLDLAVVDAIAGPDGFPLRRWWVLDHLLHSAGKWLVVLVAVLAAAGAVAARWLPAL